MKYFGYARNVNKRIFRERGMTFNPEKAIVVTLQDYEMRFNKKSLYYPGYGGANINPKVSAKVEGILYDIADHEITLLDQFEGYPEHYTREYVMVSTKSGELIQAVAYIAAPEFMQEGLSPHPEYLADILEGARGHFSPEYIGRLESYHRSSRERK